ncbi:DgyrCDS13921 [Dimorphilus gyrociliatus]|uniref:DgyrCDS13921 n=1 Tax=Dimorphilus gyrociliatus TaxID=2664684 RepID=A0A7I8WC51_9ANNE|nr:DgyrCDS13921 [Dimorphilus gyrociliatus]
MREGLMAAGSKRWIFTAEQLQNTPSRQDGVDGKKELYYRQQAASTIQDLGQKLQTVSLACLFLAAKVEEQPKKLEYLVRYSYMMSHNKDPKNLDVKSKEGTIDYKVVCAGFDLTVTHPHMHVMETCNLVRAPKDLAQTSYFLATNSLHLTTLCLQHETKVVSVVCIHLACKWSNWEIPESSEGKPWWHYTDKSITNKLIDKLTDEFLAVLDQCPSKLKSKIMQWENKKPSDSPPQSSDSPVSTTVSKPPVKTSTASETQKPQVPPATSSHQHHNSAPGKLRPPHLPSTDTSTLRRTSTEPVLAHHHHNTHHHHTSGNPSMSKPPQSHPHKKIAPPRTPLGSPPPANIRRRAKPPEVKKPEATGPKQEPKREIPEVKKEATEPSKILKDALPSLPKPLSPLDKVKPESSPPKQDEPKDSEKEKLELGKITIRIKVPTAPDDPAALASNSKDKKKKKKKHKEGKDKKHKKDKDDRKRAHSPIASSERPKKFPKLEPVLNGDNDKGLKVKLKK